jgi:hypothetical protein
MWPLLVSLPGLTGQSSIRGRWLLDRPVKLGDDESGVNTIKNALVVAIDPGLVPAF